MYNFIIRTFYLVVFIELFAAFEAKRVTTRERQWFLVIMIVCFETNSTFKNVIHLYLVGF
jgi:hypothetical protein